MQDSPKLPYFRSRYCLVSVLSFLYIYCNSFRGLLPLDCQSRFPTNRVFVLVSHVSALLVRGLIFESFQLTRLASLGTNRLSWDLGTKIIPQSTAKCRFVKLSENVALFLERGAACVEVVVFPRFRPGFPTVRTPIGYLSAVRD